MDREATENERATAKNERITAKNEQLTYSTLQEELNVSSDYLEMRKTKSIRQMFEEGMFE